MDARYLSCKARASGVMDERGVNDTWLDDVSNTDSFPARLWILLDIVREMRQLEHSLELCLLLKPVWILHAIE